jgi:RHS repeat-associated protein
MTTKSTWADISRAASAMPPTCFDGYFGEGISDAIVRKSAKDWPGFVKELTKHSAADDRFLVLILKSINATLDPDDIKAMSKLARDSCPSSLKAPCAAILEQARIALADYDNSSPKEKP